MSPALRRLANAATAAWLGITGVTGVSPVGPVLATPCNPGGGGGVSLGDFIMWDGPGGGSASLPVWSARACSNARTITFETYDITARGGDDYVAVKPGTFVFPAGTTSTTLTIQILGDNLKEPDETFGVRLLSGADFDDPDGIVTLKDP